MLPSAAPRGAAVGACTGLPVVERVGVVDGGLARLIGPVAG
jgi:hypothetical protein